MTARDDRKNVRTAHSNPINYTCGECKQVHAYSDEFYVCPNKPEDEPPKEVS